MQPSNPILSDVYKAARTGNECGTIDREYGVTYGAHTDGDGTVTISTFPTTEATQTFDAAVEWEAFHDAVAAFLTAVRDQ